MKRGDLVVATGPGFGTKPRPFVVIQSSDYAALTTLVVLPITTELAEPSSLLRVRISPNSDNGLREISEVMADIPITIRVTKVDKRIGQLTQQDIARVEQALLLVLGFAG